TVCVWRFVIRTYRYLVCSITLNRFFLSMATSNSTTLLRLHWRKKMRVHAKYTRNNNQEELYFVDPIKVLDESISLNDALIEAEAAQKSGQYAVVMVDYESYDKSRESFKIGIFDAPV